MARQGARGRALALATGLALAVSLAVCGGAAARRWLTLLLLAWASLLVLVTTIGHAHAAAPSNAESITTELHPGWNMVGWLGPETPVSELFDAVPALEQIYAWNGAEQRYQGALPTGTPLHGLRPLVPGMGLWLRIGGTEPVTWTHPTQPDSEAGFIALRAGWNLVAWAGRDGTAVAEAFLAIGSSLRTALTWDAEAGRFLRYAPGAPATINTLRHLDRGDALWLIVMAESHWLQPGSQDLLAAPPLDLGLSPFYEKYVDAGGIPIVSSAAVPDVALVRVGKLMGEMLIVRPDLRETLAVLGTRVAVLAQGDVLTDLPEFGQFLEQYPDAVTFDGRHFDDLRGAGATLELPVTVVAEENVLCYPDRPYREDVFIHEYAHTVFDLAIAGPAGQGELRRRLAQAFRDASEQGLWAHTYAASRADEYWAVAVQAWFDVGGSPNGVDTRSELQTYDPPVASLVQEVFGDATLASSCHLGAYGETVVKPQLIEGRVVDAENNPLGGVTLWAWAQPDNEWSSFAVTNTAGEFGMPVANGAFIIGVHLDPFGTNTLIGWYGRSGFAYLREEAARIVIAGEDVTGVVIRVPVSALDREQPR